MKGSQTLNVAVTKGPSLVGLGTGIPMALNNFRISGLRGVLGRLAADAEIRF